MQENQSSYKPRFRISIFFWGVLLPIILLLSFGSSSGNSFLEVLAHNIFSTNWHFFAATIVPIANLIALFPIPKKGFFFVGFSNGMAMGISLIYCIIFNKWMIDPLALLFGLGLFISPLTSFIATMMCRNNLNHLALASGCRKNYGLWSGIAVGDCELCTPWCRKTSESVLWSGIAVGVCMMILIESPVCYTIKRMRMASSKDTEIQVKGIRSLRQSDNNKLIHHLISKKPFDLYPSYHHPLWGRFFEITPDPLRPKTSDRQSEHLYYEMLRISKAHEIYYRITGTVPIYHDDHNGLIAWMYNASQGDSQTRDRLYSENSPVLKENSPLRVIIVIDGSVGMKNHVQEIVEIFNKLPENIEIGVIFASDGPEEIVSLKQGNKAVYQEIGDRVKKLSYEGGGDNVAALERAADMFKSTASVIFWIHGTQPQLWQKIIPLYKKLTSAGSFHIQDRLFHIQLEQGKNLLLEAIGLNFHEITADRLKDEFRSFEKYYQVREGSEAVEPSDAMERHDTPAIPAPEPATLWLMAVAILLFFILKKLKRI